MNGIDFGLDGLTPADTATAELVESLHSGDLTALAQHHTSPGGSHSYLVAHDGAATWGVPGAPQVVAVAVARDLSRRTFSLETSYHAAVPFAQNWLIERGCPPERIALVGDGYLKPDDDLTLRGEQQIRQSGTRYEVLDHHSSDADPSETWTLTRDTSAVQAPVRVFLEEWDQDAGTYTMREGAFTDEGAARCWLDDRDDVLPEPPEYNDADGAVVRARIARTALARSASALATRNAGPKVHRAPSAGQAQRTTQGRLL